MKALLVTPTLIDDVPTVETEIVTVDSYKDIAPLLGCRLFASAGYPAEHISALTDDEGLLTLTEDSLFLFVPWYPQPLVGPLLLQGFDHTTGDNTELNLEKAQAIITEIQAATLHTVQILTNEGLI